jgi:hypothetical protein
MLIIMPCQVGPRSMRPLRCLATVIIAQHTGGPQVLCGAVRPPPPSLVFFR